MMTKITVFMSLWILFFSLMILGCAEKKTDELLIKEQIDALQEAIETNDRGQFMDVIDVEYSDQLNSDRKSLQRMLMGFFLRYQAISVYVSATQINIQKIRADAQSQVVLTGGKHLIPDNARHYEVHSCWKKVSDEWLLSCLEWQ
ncbi:MAG: hypothetical protein KZQ64_07550 [gamma proteobacterium symbiont of Bathyaustriella thionipta]|nr:hypothetical protein [gamma proteobacterium symbiont of Bathyaustriella thionipta]MCU7953226.1 hypothetical protein [gamma proteobacterium symbiont of Bathyaustriella thionipta]MCU7956095.1 hypothetical protein [gamma proteobacterium symbiont of Bathyaustriella thionipta]